MNANEKTTWASEMTTKLNTARKAIVLWNTLARAARGLIDMYTEGGAPANGLTIKLTGILEASIKASADFEKYIGVWQPQVEQAVRDLTGGDNG